MLTSDAHRGVTIGHIQCDKRRDTIRAREPTAAVNRLLKTAVLVLLLALVPFRAIAAATADLCDAAQKDPVQAQAQLSDHDDRAGTPHAHDGEHCTTMLVVPSANQVSLPGDMRADRPAHGELPAAGFIPEHLDPPPLAG